MNPQTPSAAQPAESPLDKLVALYSNGHYEAALAVAEQALPDDAGNFALLNAAAVCAQACDLGDKAEYYWTQAIAINPGANEAHYNLAGVLHDFQRYAEAETHYRMAIALKPDYIEAYYNLGILLNDLNRPNEAEASYRKALEFNPRFAEAYYNLGLLLQESNRLDEAERSYRMALAINPEFAEAEYNLGALLQDLKRFAEAESCYRRVLTSIPHYVEAIYNLGIVQQGLNNLAAAELSYRQALNIDPHYAEAHNNLGVVLSDLGKTGAAIACHQQAIALKPDYADAYNNLAVTLLKQGRVDKGIENLRAALQINPNYREAHSNLICAMDLADDVDSAAHFGELVKWDERHAAPLLNNTAYSNTPEPERRLRIGYVSADFSGHSAAKGFGALLTSFNHSQFDVIAYSNTASKNIDDITRQFQQSVTQWRNIADLSDEAVADLIRQDKIDILVDFSGHSLGNRLLVFARKPAPLQATGWGYASSTGMRAVDVFFTDERIVPPEEKRFYAEEVRYLPNFVNYFCPHPFPEVNALPALSAPGVTFGSFNRLVKYSDEVFHFWSQLLLRLPNSRLILKTVELDDQRAKEYIAGRFARADVDPARIILLGRSPWADHMAAFRQIDISLDPFPHGGGITTLESLKMGVPVVSLCWPTLAGRMSASIIATLGLSDWIAETPEQYIDIAIQKAQQLPSLALLRSRLRDIFNTSVIGDPVAYVKTVETEYRQLWREWCKNKT